MQAVVQELRGEKIDIVPWDQDPARYIINAIQPAEVNKVIVDEADHRMELVVPDEKLSLAIGRKGQNVRLASQLTGWKLDIISESKFQQMEEEALVAAPRDRRRRRGPGEEHVPPRASARSKRSRRPRSRSSSTIHGHRRTGARRGAQASGRRRHGARCARSASAAPRRASSRSPSDEKLRFVQGVGARTVQLLEEAGYRRVEDLAREDPDRLAIKTGLGIKKARQIHEAAATF